MQTSTLFLLTAIQWLMSTLSPVYAAEPVFPDIEDSALQEAVSLFHEEGILQGYDDGLFHPERTINRAEALKIILRSQKARIYEAQPDTKSPFNDVERSDWFFPYVYTANYLKVIKGYDDGSYRPNQAVNRAEFVKMAVKLFPDYAITDLYEQIEIASTIPDVEMHDWVMPFLAYLQERGMASFPHGFDPELGMTRGDAVLLLQSMHDVDQRDKAAWKEQFHQRGCEMCVLGVDYSQYAWAHSPYITIKDGNIFIDRYPDLMKMLKQGLYDAGNVEFSVNRSIMNEYALDVPAEQMARFDQDFPVLYQKIIGMTGGFMRDGKLYDGTGANEIFLADGRMLDPHRYEELYERYVIKVFGYGEQYNPDGLDFHDWKYTLEGKRGMLAAYWELLYFDDEGL